jgi:hypothetical protein
MRGLRGSILAVTIAHLKSKTLRIGLTGGGQPHLFLQPLLEARQDRITLA